MKTTDTLPCLESLHKSRLARQNWMINQTEDWDMFLEKGKRYRLMMMTGTILEVQITDPEGFFNTFHCKNIKGKKQWQFYYWDVNY